jgi:predicted transposase/invertase (TIGR01784 family)
MIFSDPRTDLAFKKLFGDIAHKNILMSFLNAVLNRSEGEKIVDVTINDPHNLPDTAGSKFSIVDVRCTDQNNHQYIVEMQVSTQKDYGVRAQYYSSYALSRQLVKGDDYERLVPVIFVGVLDFTLFKDDDAYLSHHHIANAKTQHCSLHHLEFHFIELSKFNKTEEELETVVDQWTYLLKNAAQLDEVPAQIKTPELKDAFDLLEQGTWSKAELEKHERELDAIRVERSVLRTAREEGVEEGFEKGREEGREEGMEKGRLEEKLSTAQKMLGRFDVNEIAEFTGLTVEQIEELKKNKTLKR